MNFISSVRFDQQTLKLRRSKVRCQTEQSLPEIPRHLRQSQRPEYLTPIKLKYVPVEQKEYYSQRQPVKSLIGKRTENSYLDHDLYSMNAALSEIRKEINNKKEEHNIIGKTKEKRKYLLSEVGVSRGREEVEKKTVWHYQQVDKQEKKLILQPVWEEIHTPKKLVNKAYLQPHIKQYISNKAVPVLEKPEQEEQERRQFNINLLFPRSYRPSQPPEQKDPTPLPVKIQQDPPPVEPIIQLKPKKINQRALKNFRKIGHVVLFTIYLRTFNERMHLTRKTLFSQYLKTHLAQTLLDLKQTLIEYCTPFFRTIIDHQNFDYHLYPSEDAALKREKVKATRKLIGVELDCLKNWVANFAQQQKYVQLFYLLCRHGNYSCLHSINTPEEINLMCISPTQGYVSASQHLQKSALISFLFVKMLLYNIFFTADTVKIPVRSPLRKQVILSNIILIGNILYQLFIDLQDQYLQQSPAVYTVGNWVTLQHRVNFKVADNMTVKEGVQQTNELISGLMDHQVVKETYQTHEMQKQRYLIKGLINQLHAGIVRYHLKMREKCFLK